MSDLDAIERLRRHWGEIYTDVYVSGTMIVSNRDAYQRTHMPSRTYEGADFWVVLQTVIEGEQA
jgi:hypothetical protein